MKGKGKQPFTCLEKDQSHTSSSCPDRSGHWLRYSLVRAPIPADGAPPPLSLSALVLTCVDGVLVDRSSASTPDGFTDSRYRIIGV